MSVINRLPRHLRPRRPKLFTDGRQAPVDPNDRARVMVLADAARRDGRITRAAVDILRSLLFTFANLKDGRCFPSYQRLAEAAGCHPRTVGRTLPDLEAAGLLTWVHRIQRVRERVAGLGGIWAATWRVIRTSNAYDFPSIAKQTRAFLDKGQKCRGTTSPVTFSLSAPVLTPQTELETALLAFGRACGAVR